MKALILAGGYAKRLWPLTKETPKPLLKVGKKEIITRIIEKLETLPEIDDIVISTNAKFEEKFKEYAANLNCKKKLELVIEPTMAEGEKLGSIGGLNFLIDHLKISKDVLVIGGDNIFEFSMKDFIACHKKSNVSSIALKRLKEKELLHNYGLCVLDKNNKIIEFQEKPKEPRSDLVSTACYIFKLDDFLLIKRYLKQGNSPDAVGFFVAWLIRQAEVHGFVFDEEWYDIGSFESLDEARKIYADK